jgi:Uma2 family endonuclease
VACGHRILHANDMKVRLRLADQDIFYHPDVLLSCDPSDRETYYSTAPCIVVEVLSESTERIDRREKLCAYTTLPSLQDYMLVSQTRREVWHHSRSRGWVADVLTDGRLTLDCLDLELTLAAIYEELDGLA